MICGWPLLAACGLAAHADPPLPPDVAVQDVLISLDEAVELAPTDLAAAELAWSRALTRFEGTVEPALRARASVAEVAAAEYAFSRIHHALSHREDATALVDDLGSALRRSFAPDLRVAAGG